MYKIENEIVYVYESGDTFESWTPYCPQHRVNSSGTTKLWERFNAETWMYESDQECTKPFPAEPATPEDRITALESENEQLAARLRSAEQAASENSTTAQGILELLIDMGVI